MTNNKLALAIIIFLIPITGNAGIETIDQIQDQFKSAVSAWVSPLQAMATWLLFTLAVISYAWKGGMMLLRGADIQEFFTELVSSVMLTGVYFFLIQEAPTVSTAIVEGWIYIGGQANGSSLSLNAGDIILMGLEAASKIIENSDYITVVPNSIASLFVVLLFCFIAGYTLVVLIEMYMVTASGVILLGFGGNEWTGDFAKRYLVYSMSVGIKLFSMFLVVSMCLNFLDTFTTSLDLTELLSSLSLIGVLIIISLFVYLIPNVVQAMVSGVSIGSVGGSAAAQAMGGVSTAAGAAGSIGKSTVGAGMAVKEAAAMAATQPGSSSGRQYQAMNTIANLANSAGAVIGNRVMGDYNASSGSMGGSMAQQMRQQRMGGSGLYGGAESSNAHIGGNSTAATAGNSIGKGGDAVKAAANGADSSKQTVAEYAEKAGYKSPAVDLTKGSSS